MVARHTVAVTLVVLLGAGASAQPTAPPGRRLLEGVRRVSWHTDRWRFAAFCNALDACLQFVGQREQYDRLMAMSGAGVRLAWSARAWDGGNSDILHMARQTLEPMRRAFRSAGWTMQAVAKAAPGAWPEDILVADTRRLGGESTDESGFRRRIVDSIDRGRPVIAFGVIGPPEACVICGYDEGGAVLLGWNTFQDEEKAETEPSGHFRLRNWYPSTHALLLLGEQTAPPAAAELRRDTLLWLVQVLRERRVGRHAAGPAAFEAWAADMRANDFFPDDPKVLLERLHSHWDGMTMQVERGGVTAFLADAALAEPVMAKQLRAAVAALQHSAVLHGVAPGEEKDIARLAQTEVREAVARSILAVGEDYQLAADHIEQALLAAGVPGAAIPRPDTEADAGPE